MDRCAWTWLCVFVVSLGCSGATDGPLTPATSAEPSTPGAVGGGGKSDSFDGDTDALWEEIARRCTPPAAGEPIVYASDFEWGYTLDEMGEKFDEMYTSGKRLDARTYYDEASGVFVLPGTDVWGGDLELPRRLVENVTLHIEHALERGYADYVFFPDMGHSHLFMPEEHWEATYEGTPVSEFSQRYERMFDDPQLMVLYHTAEQLQMHDAEGNLLDDRRILWRFHTRNVVGDNDYERRIELLTEYESNANTSRDMPGYNYYGAGFNITATKDGCFPYEHEGETRWYDISLSDLPYDASEGGGGYL